MLFVFHHECFYEVEIRFKWKTCGRFAKHNLTPSTKATLSGSSGKIILLKCSAVGFRLYTSQGLNDAKIYLPLT